MPRTSLSRLRKLVTYIVVGFVVLSASLLLLWQISPLPSSVHDSVFTPSPPKPKQTPRPKPVLQPNPELSSDVHGHGHPPECHVDLDILKSFGSNSTEYARWEITVVQAPDFTGFSNNLSLPLPTYEPVELDTQERYQTLPPDQCSATITLEAPLPVTSLDASHLIFGVATTLDRLNDSLDAIVHWAGGTNARIIALVEKDKPAKKTQVLQAASAQDIQLTITESSDGFLDRYFSLTKLLFQHRTPATEWAILIDDDTFFPSMSGLINRLATYNSSLPHYIGAPTENIAQMSIFGYMAYGGAGIFLSTPLLSQINEFYDECALIKDTGDKRIARCIYTHTDTKFTWDRRLFQMDFHSDASGFYESGRPLPLSLHHWKSAEWSPVDVVAMGKVAAMCGDECLLRRWKISDRWFFINGFSLVQYSRPLTESDLKGMELTWEPSQWAQDEGYAYSLGPLRQKDEGKVSLRLRRSVAESGSLRQFYVDEEVSGQPSRVLEIVWRLGKRKGVF